ncbi:hypothetical protein GQ55_5G242500 [Panicum hallii var. hallii]|uniref:Uncharacterized protein n=1 Tax=Panicum hallii var. hallii TaxID=1504633 RepID=A0A2T7DJR1_9POAL|nr:hypothetical protein GQ55_5G242500 [Panicum hallii var. hallii]
MTGGARPHGRAARRQAVGERLASEEHDGKWGRDIVAAGRRRCAGRRAGARHRVGAQRAGAAGEGVAGGMARHGTERASGRWPAHEPRVAADVEADEQQRKKKIGLRKKKRQVKRE